MFHDTARKWLGYIIQPVAQLIAAIGVTANMLTITGLIFGISAGVCIAFGYLKLAGILILVGGTFDLMDGAVARVNKAASAFGALLDSVVDRYSEGAVFLGIAIYFSRFSSDIYKAIIGLSLTGFALIGSFLVSYVRARAEGLRVECKVGIMQRPERVILLSLGVIFGKLYILLVIVLCILAILSHFTVLQRVLFASKEFNGSRA
jgi:phosphatidylglycerophosphate synthase